MPGKAKKVGAGARIESKQLAALEEITNEIVFSKRQCLGNVVRDETVLKVHPQQNPPVRNQPIIFSHDGDPYHYLDLNKTCFQFKIKLTQADDADLPDGAAVAPINDVAHSMFRRITTFINSIEVSVNDNLYAYKAFIARALTHTKSMNAGIDSVWSIFEKDAPTGHYNSTNNANNTGMESRRAKFAASRIVTVRMRPRDAIWNQDRDIPPNFPIKIVFDRVTDAFLTMEHVVAGGASANYRIHVTDAVMLLCLKNVSPEIAEQNYRQLCSTEGLCYNLRPIDARVLTIPQNSRNAYFTNVYTGMLPTTFGFCLVDATSFNGDATRNPFYFHHYNLDLVRVKINNTIWRNDTLETNFAAGVNQDYKSAYSLFLDQLGFRSGEPALDVSEAEWGSTHNIWIFDTIPDA